MNKSMITAAALLLAGSLCAALTEKDLTPQAIVPAIAAQPENQRQAYAREVLQAIATSPADDTAKTQALTSASRALIAGAGASQGIAVIAEIFNTVPVAQLQGVADLLAEANFGQATNGFTDAQYDDFCTKVVASASRYIEASGTDSPAVRMSILAATFTKASASPDRTRPKLIAALPTAVQAAAATYVAASEQGNREVIAAATGVDEVTATPADPDAANVVAAPASQAAQAAAAQSAPAPAAAAQPAAAQAAAADAAVGDPAEPERLTARTDYLEPAPIPAEGDDAGEAQTVEVKVPLLSRYTTDVSGLTTAAMMASMYNWEVQSPGVVSLPGLGGPIEPVAGIDEQIPENFPRPKKLPPSPLYGNQRIF